MPARTTAHTSLRLQATKGLVQRRHVWFARVQVPHDCRHRLGKGVLIRTTQQTELARAIPVAQPILAEFHRMIEEARGRPWTAPEQVKVKAGSATARRALRASQRDLRPFVGMVDAWEVQLRRQGMKERVISQYVSDVRQLATWRPEGLLLAQVDHDMLQQWVVSRGRLGESPKTTTRRLTSIRSYWAFLQDDGAVPGGASPAKDLRMHKGSGQDAVVRKPLSEAQLGLLWRGAKALNDQPLADLIALAAYTGARIEELCGLTTDRVDLGEETITIVDAKTEAGNRVVPIARPAQALVARLVRDAQRLPKGPHGWLIHSTARNQYGERGVPLSKRFGRLKANEGLGPEYVFHSIRKTFATKLKSLGCPEPIAADLLGHEINTMSYGLYAGVSELNVRREWVDRVGVVAEIVEGLLGV